MKDTKVNARPQATPAEDQTSTAPVSDQQAQPASEQGQQPLSSELIKENAEMKDRLLRTLAEMENLRRRTEREVADVRQYGIAGFARDVLGVADNMRRALEAIGPELRDSTDMAVKSLIEGVDLTERELLKVMEKNGVRKFDPQGQKFDPNLHQAMFEVPDASVPSGTVVQVMQSGYMIGDRILRPALVGVAKGGPKQAAPENANTSTAPQEPH